MCFRNIALDAGAPASLKLGDKFSKKLILTAFVFVVMLRKRMDERDAKLEETT